MNKKLMIYGATGYSGRLIAQEAIKRGMKPILAGRSVNRLKLISDETGLEYRVFDMNDPEIIDKALRDIDIIINSAGPFSMTAVPVVESCLRTETHYLDIAGEINDFEMLAGYDSEARKKNIMIMPGTGYDVVPSDCLSLYLSKKISNPEKLIICMSALRTMSHGTFKTGIEGIQHGNRIRKDGRIIKRKMIKFRRADFGDRRKLCISFSWGDVSTAYYTTGIGNIENFIELTPGNLLIVFINQYLGWFYGTPFMQKLLMKHADKKTEGPSEEKRNSDKAVFVATVEGKDGSSVSARLTTPEGYKLTYLACVHIAEKVLTGKIKNGFYTPALFFGQDLIMEIEGVSRADL